MLQKESKETVKAGIQVLLVLSILSVVAMLVAAPAGFISKAVNFASYKFWAPKEANVEREVFENTKSYRQGRAQELYKLQGEYLQITDPVQKKGLANVIKQRFADADESALPTDLVDFLRQMRRM